MAHLMDDRRSEVAFDKLTFNMRYYLVSLYM